LRNIFIQSSVFKSYEAGKSTGPAHREAYDATEAEERNAQAAQYRALERLAMTAEVNYYILFGVEP
jgi:hypothetical protein